MFIDPSPLSLFFQVFLSLFFQEGNRILSRKKLALKKRSFVNLYNTGVNIHSRRLSYDSVVGVARNTQPSHSWPSENIS